MVCVMLCCIVMCGFSCVVLSAQSKVDAIQLLFYMLLGAPTDQDTTKAEFYYYSNAILEVSEAGSAVFTRHTSCLF